jgi:hypothetical protein
MVGEGLSGHPDGSFGVHNPFLALALLRANIKELQLIYGVTAPPATVQAVMNEAASSLERVRTTAKATGKAVPSSWQHGGISARAGGRE